MKSNYRKLKEFIRQVDVRNVDGKEDNLLGVSVQKIFIPSIANTVGTDFTKYKIVKKGQFTYIPDTSRRGDKIGIALLEDYEEGLVSNVYTVFEIIDEKRLIPKYLMLWFSRSEFDRYARFKSHGSVREIMDWEEMCNVEIPVPTYEEQRKIVKAYEIIMNRILLKQKINDNLESIAQTFFQEYFGSIYGSSELPNGWKYTTLEKLCTVKGGKRIPADCELTNIPTEHPYIRVRDVGTSRYVCLTNQFQYIDEETYSQISKYIINEDDIIISIVGTIGLIGKIHTSLDGANLTENCVKLSDIHSVTPDYLYYTLMYKRQIKEFELLTVGAVQAKLPIYNVQSISILLPDQESLSAFQSKIDCINQQVESNTIEIQRLDNLGKMLLATLSR